MPSDSFDCGGQNRPNRSNQGLPPTWTNRLHSITAKRSLCVQGRASYHEASNVAATPSCSIQNTKGILCESTYVLLPTDYAYHNSAASIQPRSISRTGYNNGFLRTPSHCSTICGCQSMAEDAVPRPESRPHVCCSCTQAVEKQD